jgi:hypothetical protein
VAAAQSIVAKWKNVVLNPVLRPSALIKDKYNEVSSDIWTAAHNTMSGQGSAEDNRAGGGVPLAPTCQSCQTQLAHWAAYCDGATLIAQVIPSKERDERRPTQDDRQQPLHSSTSTMPLGLCSPHLGRDRSLLPSIFSSVGGTPRSVRSGGGGKSGGLRIRSRVSRSSSLR